MRPLSAMLLEGLLVTGSGVLLAALANALHPDGLSLRRDYFPSPVPARAEAPPQAPAASHADAASPAAAGAGEAEPTLQPLAAPAQGGDAAAETAQRLAAKGLATLAFDEVKALFEDPLYAAGAYLFLDARSDEHFAEGHIPGAMPLDHYHLERHIDAVLAALPGTARVVLYCHGGNCEDSEFAALDLVGFGVPAGQLAIYLGGIEEWKARGMPVQSGPSQP